MTEKKLTGAIIKTRYIPITSAALWDRNPKKHSIPRIIEAIEKHGFRDAPIYDGTLNAIAAGNGRTQALIAMREMGKNPPIGIAVDKDNEWHMPVQFGIDAKSVAAAEAFGVSHNNLTMSGGEFTAVDIAKMWNGEDYLKLLDSLNDQGEMPDGITLADLSEIDAMLHPDPKVSPDEFPEYTDDIETEYQCPSCGYEWSGQTS